MLQLTVAGDSGIDHGELCRSTCARRQPGHPLRSEIHIGQPVAATRERQKIN
jgi:hypothetical protein